jgi:hypothetical protein
MARPRTTNHKRKFGFTLNDDSVAILESLGGENKSQFVDDVLIDWFLMSDDSGFFSKRFGGVAIRSIDDLYCFVDLNNEIIEEFGFYKTVSEILNKRKELIEKHK